MTRKLSKLLETYSVQHDGSVRNNVGDCLQLAYGGDALCSEQLESVHCKGVNATETQWSEGACHVALSAIGARLAAKIRACKHAFADHASNELLVPLNLQRWLMRSRRMSSLEGGPACSLGDALARLPLPGAVYAAWVMRDEPCARTALAGMHAMYLAYAYARAPAGYCPGVIAAQSLGCPITQMTLNSACPDASCVSRPNGRPPPPRARSFPFSRSWRQLGQRRRASTARAARR